MFKLTPLLVWLSRFHRCRGFGVQSPWAYRMVRYVVNEHWPYYAYSRLAAEFPHIDKLTRKLCQLCFRLANDVQPLVSVGFGVDGGLFGGYVHAGCRRTAFLSIDSVAGLEGCASVDMALIAPSSGFRQVFHSVCQRASDGTVVVLFDIYADKSMRRLWREVVDGMQGVVTFDLYYCGLVFFDSKRFKQNYIINF